MLDMMAVRASNVKHLLLQRWIASPALRAAYAAASAVAYKLSDTQTLGLAAHLVYQRIELKGIGQAW